MASSTLTIPPLTRYKSITYGIRRGNGSLPDNIIVYDRHKIDTQASYFHQDDGFFLIYCHEGKGTVCIDEDFFDFKPGNILIVFPWQMHCYLNLELPRRWIYVRANWNPPEGVYRLRNQLMTILPEELSLLQKIVVLWNDCNEEETAWRVDYLSGLMTTLICGLLNRSRCQEHDFPAAEMQKNHRLVERINCYIYQHFGSPFNIHQMAGELGSSPNYLGAVFKKKYFVTLESYIKNLRIDHAKKLLSGTQMSIGEIAEKLGFSSLYSFSNCFRKVTELSPTAYRKSVTLHRGVGSAPLGK